MAPAEGEREKGAMGRRKGAYVTFLAGDGDYVMGVVGLAKGLRKVGSAYPLVVAALPDVPERHRRLLRSQGCLLREIEPLHPPENRTHFAMPYYVINYSKLRIWQVTTPSPCSHLHSRFLVKRRFCVCACRWCSSWSTGRWCTWTQTSRCSRALTICLTCRTGTSTRSRTASARGPGATRGSTRLATVSSAQRGRRGRRRHSARRRRRTSTPVCSSTSPAWRPATASSAPCWRRRRRPSRSKTSSTPSSATPSGRSPRRTTSSSPCCGATRRGSPPARPRSSTTARR